jgi:hypothetical protein
MKLVVAAMAGGAALVGLVGALRIGFEEAPEPLWVGIFVLLAVIAIGAALVESPAIMARALSFGADRCCRPERTAPRWSG